MRLPLSELPAAVQGLPVYGIETRDLAPVGMPTEGLGVIAGPSGSGVSTAALSCAEAFERWSRETGRRSRRVLLSFAPDGLARRAAWRRSAIGGEAVAELGRELLLALGGNPGTSGRELGGRPGTSGTESGSEAEHAGGIAVGHRALIVVERPGDAEGTAALPHLVALAKAARRARALVLFEFEPGTGGAIWDLYSALRQPTWGLALQPDEAESQSPFREPLGRVRRDEFPPGRGFAIEGGRLTPVQVALPSPVAAP
mgnify:CR=1 FL=1